MNEQRTRLSVVVAILVAATAGGGWMLQRGFALRDAAPGARLFDQVVAHVANRYLDSIEAHELYARAAAGLVRELGDPHSVYLDSTRLRRVQALTSGFISGTVGIGLEVDVRDGWVNVVAAGPGTPAERVGLRPGDRILAVSGRSTRGWTTDETRRALRGSAGTAVTLTVDRFGGAGRVELSVVREPVEVHPVHRVMLLDDGFGYLALRSFSDSAVHEVAAAVDSLYQAGMRALVLDLRGNPGGLLAQGTEVADLFLDSGQTIVSLRGRGPNGKRDDRDYVDQRPQRWGDLRIAVLVDRGTASASEIVAGALQDHDRAVVVGLPTYGKGSAQSVFAFTEGGGVKLTTARWYTPSGRSIDFAAAPPDEDQAAGPDSGDRPVFHTDSGRIVYGGGGITPDVPAGDSVVPRGQRALYLALGSRFQRLREAVAAEAQALSKHGVSDPLFVVTPTMRDAVYSRLLAGGVRLDRRTFDGASDLVDQSLGRATTLAAFGRAAETRRIVARDRVVQEAIARLRPESAGRRAQK
jgi:carboxyl-terminal processing protease